jgi:3-phosphoshikimate 1-carboxyvinyltransferase
VSALTVHPGGALHGRLRVPGDKSISHRALLLGALAEGTSTIHGFLPSGDCLATLGCLEALGIVVERESETELTVRGHGLHGLESPTEALNCIRSGTTMRLLAGMMAGQRFDSTLTGDPQLLRRPMGRVVVPLRCMGAVITDAEGCAPLAIQGQPLHGMEHRLEIASAQVKSALLLAGLYAEGTTTVSQPGPARDHTERMLAAMGAALTVEGLTVRLTPPEQLMPLAFTVPGDPSSAAFPLVAALLVPGSEITLEGVGLNPTRTGLLDVLSAMGAQIGVGPVREEGGEPVGEITVRASALVATEVGGDTVVRMIDEFPVFVVAATQAQGTTVVRDATELRVKETDRVATVVAELQKLGAHIEARPDGFVVEGPTVLHGGTVDSHGDHRLGMALAVAGLIAEGGVVVEGAERIVDSFPGFSAMMRAIGADYD